jgi:hypothetical protein
MASMSVYYFYINLETRYISKHSWSALFTVLQLKGRRLS